MSNTQEKLEQKIFNLVYQWGRVGIVTDHTAPTYVAYIQELIDSAKREELKALKKESYACNCASGGAGYVDAVFVEDIDDRIAQLEQSEESEQ